MNALTTPKQCNTHILHWFRRDLRIHDNTALAYAINYAQERNGKVSTIFVVTPQQWKNHDMSAVQLDFIFRTLIALQRSLFEYWGIQLHILSATDFNDGNNKLLNFCQTPRNQDHQVTNVVANMEYEVHETQRDLNLGKRLETQGVSFTTFHDQCILPPKSVITGNGNMYQIFTPFYKNWQNQLDVSPPNLHLFNESPHFKQNIDNDWLNTAQNELQTLYQKVLTDYLSYNEQHHAQTLKHCREHYPAGEVEAKQRLETFIHNDISHYDTARDHPALYATSRLSAYLTIGAISPRHCYLQAKHILENKSEHSIDINHWISELAWRDFYRHVIVYRPDIVKHHAFRQDVDKVVNWSYDKASFQRWCEGTTGVPLVDAAMRCLNATGFMHNRLRMVTAMFLTKDLLIDWRWGEQYFMQHLIDGDFASNNGGWQWSASIGTDAAPYFRIMNPFNQSKTYDKNAEFIKTWLPELKNMPSKVLHDEMKLRKTLSDTGRINMINYPLSMIDHKQARKMAIAEFKRE